MKKFLMVLFILVLLAAGGAAVFLWTLNADQYRPLVTEQLQKNLGMPVKLEKISFAWRSGVALSLQGLVIGAAPDFREEMVRVESASAVLNLAPLLAHEVQISSIYINEPKIRLIRKADGTILGLEPKSAKTSEVTVSGKKVPLGTSSPTATAALSFLVDQIKIDSGEVFFRDESGPKVMEVRLRDVDLKIDNAALDRPVAVDLKAALLSSRQNLNMDGEVKFSAKTQELVLEKFSGEVDMESLELQELFRLVPDLVSSGLEQLSGRLQIQTNGRIPLNSKDILTASASLLLQDGKIRLAGLSTPIDNLVVDLGMQSSLIKIRKASADFAGGSLNIDGQMNLKTVKPLTAFKVNLNKLLMESLTPQVSDPSAPKLQGSLSGAFEGTFAGSSGAEIQRTLAGEGVLTLERGVIRNLNILREVFRKLSMIPGLMDTLRKRLPEDYQEKLDAKDTVLSTVDLPVTAADGVLIFNRLDVQTDSFALQGGGSYGMASGAVGAQANLFIEPQLSEALIRSVNELQYLTDRKSGALMIPLNIQGRAPQISVVPDLQYIASRLAVAKTQDLLGSFLKKPESQTIDPSTGQSVSQTGTSVQSIPESETGSSKTKYPKGSEIIGALLQNALQGQSGSDGSSDDSGSQRASSFF